MKWHKLNIIMLFLSMFLLQGCKQIDINVEGKIGAPIVEKLPIQGTWRVENYTSINKIVSEKEADDYKGSTAVFDKTRAVLGMESCSSPEYKLKNVSAEEYFLYKYKVNALKAGVKEKNVNIITVSSKQQPFHDFILLDDKSMLVYEEQGFLYLTKVSDKLDNNINYSNTGNMDKQEAATTKASPSLKSGIFLGLRSTAALSSTGSSYRTLWIASQNRDLRPIYEMKQLLVPRKTGFWEIDYWSQKAADKLKGTLYAHSLTDDTSNSVKNTNNLLEDNGRRDIVFVGNDYIGTEYRYIDAATSKETSKYQVLPIDNVKNGVGINISDLAGDDGLNALIHSNQAYAITLVKNKADRLNKEPDGTNFSLVRRNGQWSMVGRVDYQTPTQGKTFEDFDIYLLPPQKLINYDELLVPWSYIKEKLPEALDAYTSPNKDIGIIITRNAVEVYTINNGKLSDKPTQSIALQNGEAVVMAEWASGDYVEKWEEIIKPRATELAGGINK